MSCNNKDTSIQHQELANTSKFKQSTIFEKKNRFLSTWNNPKKICDFNGFFYICHRSSIHASSDIVKRVEAALASAELTPPRSTPESPDRSSSPDSDVVIADRDVMSLPLRKRKNYPRDGAIGQGHSDEAQPPQMMRMSSVIQFAKAS